MEPPGELAVRPGRGRPAGLPVEIGHDVDDAAGGPRRIEPGTGLAAQHLGRVLQRPGGRHEPSGRHGQAHVVIAVPHVELGGAEVLIGLPSVDVVVDRHLRIPVVDEIHLAVLAAAWRAVGRHSELPLEGEVGLAARRDRLGQAETHDGPVHLVAWALASGRRELTPLSSHPVELDSLDRPGHVGVVPRTGGEDVLQELDVDGAKGIGRAVVVGDGALSGEALRHRVELRLELVVRPLLPVTGPGRAARAPGAPIQRQVVSRQAGHRHRPWGGAAIAPAVRGRRRSAGRRPAAGAGREHRCEEHRGQEATGVSLHPDRDTGGVGTEGHRMLRSGWSRAFRPGG